MKLIEKCLIKLQYDSEGRLFMRSFKNVRTDNEKYYKKKENEFFKKCNTATDIIALWDMKYDKFYFFSYMINPITKFNSFGLDFFPSSCFKYPFELSDIKKRYIKNVR